MNNNLIDFCKKGIIVGVFLCVGIELVDTVERRVITKKMHKIQNLSLDIQESILKNSKPKKRRLFR